MKRVVFILLCWLLVLPLAAEDELCVGGDLLFLEDFGGNDPSAPTVSTKAVPGMSNTYIQVFNTETQGDDQDMHSGRYIVTKRGYRNSSYLNYSVWHIMDDHTSFGDLTQGYFLEVDGKGGSDAFYSTIVDGLEPGTMISFTAYAANVTTAGQYNVWRNESGRGYVHPQLSFIITDPTTNTELARYNTDTIGHDWSLFGTPDAWKYSAHWQLVGMNFTIPAGVTKIKISIHNNANGSTGNDFALDDIEVRSCVPPQPSDICTDGVRLFREDFGGNNPSDPEVSSAGVPSISNLYKNGYSEFTQFGFISTFEYLRTKRSQGNNQWHAQDDHTYPDDYTRGYFLEVDAYGGDIYKKTLSGTLIPGSTLSFSAYVVNMHDACMIPGIQDFYGYTYPSLKFVIKDATNGKTLATHSTGAIIPDPDKVCQGSLEKQEEWQLVGLSCTIPENVESIQMIIQNDAAGYEGNDFGIDDIEIHLCARATKTLNHDTVVCDTIPFIEWRNTIYPLASELRDTIRDGYGMDSVYHVLNVTIEHCCPEYPTIERDTAVCDTLLPFEWIIDGRTLVFEKAETQEIELPHPKWTGCADVVYAYTLETYRCFRLYPIIVNKYNQVLLLDNVKLAELFPEQKAVGYQWYKDGEAIDGATKDDYSEEGELHGAFQLYVTLDNEDEIHSNVITIHATSQQQPVLLRVYDSHGLQIQPGQIGRGVYLLLYQQGEHIWAEKKYFDKN